MSKSGTKDRRFKNCVGTICKNHKIEIIIYLVLLVCIIVSSIFSAISSFIEQHLEAYFTSDRVALITSIMAIFIGIYVTVLTIVATSRISVTELILKSKLDKQILTIIYFGIVEDFILVLLGVFFDITGWVLLLVFLVLSCTTMISFIKFVCLVYTMFKKNIEAMVKEIDKETTDRAKLSSNIEEILHRTKKK